MKQKTKSTFRFPFDIDARIFLALALVFFILSISQVNNFLFPKMRMDKLKLKIEKDIRSKIIAFDKSEEIKSLLVKSCRNELTEENNNKLTNLSYGIQVFYQNKLVFWNTNKLPFLEDTFAINKPYAISDVNGYYVAIKKELKTDLANVLLIFPVKYQQNIDNSYLRNHFVVGDAENDYGINLTTVKKNNYDLPITINDKDVFYLNKEDDFLSINDSGGSRLFWNAFSYIFFGISLHTYFKVTSKRRVALKRFLFMILLAAVIRALNYFFAFPENFSNYALFSPEYYASSSFNCSLGDTLINMCLFFWGLLFYIINVQGVYQDYQKLTSRIGYGILLFFLLTIGQVYFLITIKSLILDSTINFDFTYFSELTLFSFIGLLTICIAFGNFLILTYISCNYYTIAFTSKYIKYFILLPSLALSYFVFQSTDFTMWLFVFVSFVVFFATYDFMFPKIKFDFNSYLLLSLIIVISSVCAIFLNTFIQEKEKLNRLAFANKLLSRNSLPVEDKLADVRNEILQDASFIQNYSTKSEINSLTLSKEIYQKFLNQTLANYKCETNLYDAGGRLVTVIQLPEGENNALSLDSISSNLNEYLLEKKQIDKIRYSEKLLGEELFSIFNNAKLIGYIKLSATDHFHASIDAKSRYDQMNNIVMSHTHSSYSYAFYDDGILTRASGSFVFPYNAINNKKLNEELFLFTKLNGKSILWVKNNNSNAFVSMSHEDNNIYLITTLFAYIFFVYFSIITIYIIANVVARSNLNYSRFVNLLNLNLRLRLHFAILMVVFFSFMVVGYFTYLIIVERIESKANDELKLSSQNIQDELNAQINIAGYTRDNLQDDSTKSIDALLSIFKKTKSQFNKDLNVYDVHSGELVFTSQSDLFQIGLLPPHIDYNVMNDIRISGIDNIQHKEFIGTYDYSSIYSYLRNKQGKVIGLMQIPSLSGNLETQNEKNTILITLINIYVFVFLLSSVLALIISNSVTRPFRFIVKQFTKINLSKTNRPLKWNSSDEIGMLVKEYNRTLRKLENSTVLLAKSEREMAWREMAKQVAHEIKNPLTPMKLSIQMLQRAIRNNSPNVQETTERVAATIVEQIDVLTDIATNFSSFAKMPENHKESILLNEVLYNVTGMYNDDHENEFLFLIPDYPIYITVDKGQLIRVFTNIIQNAIQSIPSGRKGNISLVVSKLKDNFVRVTIMDNGEGISIEKGAKLFEPYFTTKSSGTGLGLAMCKDIVESFGGNISFESKINELTSFHVDLLMDVDLDEDSLDDL